MLIYLWLCFLPLILVEISVVKLRGSEAAVLGRYEKKTYMRSETKSFYVWVMQFLVNSLFYSRTSKVNSFTYNLLNVSIQSVYLEISYFSMIESYTDLDLHLQFVCLFHNKRLYIDCSNDYKYILPTSKLTGNLSCWILLLA